ncbi:MOFRL family protein [Halomonas sp.]|uniref:MOFRL family protein n=1 Tax=Halomonas sp. TaxID=1486246 RepID=UPI003851364C
MGKGTTATSFRCLCASSCDWCTGLDPYDYLSRNDAYTFHQSHDRHIQTGPMRTNVNDLRAILALPRTP